MKRLAISLLIIVLLTIFVPSFSILAQSTHTPHENPATAQSSPDPAALMLSYSKTFELVSFRQYQDATSLLEELEHVNIPTEINYVINRYNTLSKQLITTLNNIESLLDQASTLSIHYQHRDAGQKLDAAQTAIFDAHLLLQEIETATDINADSLGVFAATATSQIYQAYQRLEESLHRLQELINELNRLRRIINDDPFAVISPSYYFPTLLEVSAPKTAYPGLPITISGRVTSAYGNPERTISVLLDNSQLAEDTLQGWFSLEIIPPPQTTTGKHSLTIMAAPLGRNSDASKELSIDITRLPTQTDIQVPRLVILPRPIRVSGKVLHNYFPIQDARVSLAFRKSSATAKTATDGSFTTAVRPPRLSVTTPTSGNPFFASATTVELPLDLSLVGPQELTVTVEPAEPWYAPLQIKRQVFVINPSNIGLMLIALLCLGALLYNQVRSRVTVAQEEEFIPQPQMKGLPPVIPKHEIKYKLSSINGRIVSAYRSGLEAVEKITGVAMTAHTTLREFLTIATPRLPTAAKSFSELTSIAEVALYSTHKLEEDMASRAEKLAAATREELHGETA